VAAAFGEAVAQDGRPLHGPATQAQRRHRAVAPVDAHRRDRIVETPKRDVRAPGDAEAHGVDHRHAAAQVRIGLRCTQFGRRELQAGVAPPAGGRVALQQQPDAPTELGHEVDARDGSGRLGTRHLHLAAERALHRLVDREHPAVRPCLHQPADEGGIRIGQPRGGSRGHAGRGRARRQQEAGNGEHSDRENAAHGRSLPRACHGCVARRAKLARDVSPMTT
jgi:hypothetical protein